MSELDKIRENINSIDEQMAQLFQERMEMSRQVAAFKKDRGLSIRDAERERELIDRDRRFIKDPAVDGYYVQFLRSILDLSCAYQSRLLNGMKVAYSGVEGAYGYIAARRMFPEAQLIAYPDFAAAHKAVEQGEADSAVLPLENSYAGCGTGNVTARLSKAGYDMIGVDDAEEMLSVAREKQDSEQILYLQQDMRSFELYGTVRAVVSHPQALRQCDDYIKRHGYATETYSNTALAAAHVRDVNDPALAAIASEEAAEVFGLRVLERGINTVRTNTTRFAALSRTRSQPETTKKREDENFVLVFTVQNDAGSLAQTLNIIGAHGYNMRTLRSRPMKGLSWKYYFYVEAEGCVNNTNGREMLQELSATCAKLRLVGSYYANTI